MDVPVAHMSDDILEAAAGTINLLQVSRYTTVAAYMVQVYDWLLLLEKEHRLIHDARWTSIKVVYLFCRYYPLVMFPLFIWAWMPDHDPKVCDAVIHPLYTLAIPFQISAQSVVCIRTYAFTGRKKIVLAILILSMLVLIGTQTWVFSIRFVVVKELFLPTGHSGCYGNDITAQLGPPFGQMKSLRAGMIMLGAFLLDLLSMTLVLLHCLHIRSTQGSLGKAFLQQGLGVFFIMSTLNLGSTSLYLTPYTQFDGFFLPFVMILSDVMACRLILMLRQKASPSEETLLELQDQIVREGLARLEGLGDIIDENLTHRTVQGADYWEC